jgi:hypothetical protein
MQRQPRQKAEWHLDFIRGLLSYDPATGEFRWRKTGIVAGSPSHHGYWKVRVLRRTCYAHRLAWFYVHGTWPIAHIDHINGNGCDNRIANLRVATRSQNLSNARKPKTNKSGFKGVSRCKKTNKWRAQIQKDGKVRALGHFERPEDAHAAYCAAAKELHGQFWRAE